MSQKALSGIRVLDLSRILAGPSCGQLLGDFGADVIKVERPGLGDDSRRLGGARVKDLAGADLELAPMFMCSNRNKRSITIDLAKPEGQALVRKLAAWADVLIENYKAGDLKRYQLDYESLKQVNPKLVYCSLTGFGQTGPYAPKPGYDSIFQAMCGLMSITGHADGKPGGGSMRVGVPITDFIGGLYAYGAIMTALHHRDRVSGKGQHIDLALLDCAISAMTLASGNYLCNGVVQERWGNESATSVPSQTFRCADGEIQLSAPNDDVFNRMCDGLGRPDIHADERFCNNFLRTKNRGALVPLLAELFAALPRQKALQLMEEATVPCAPIYAMDEVFADPQVQHRGNMIELPHSAAGSVRIGTNPIHMSDTPITSYTPPPRLGEHTVDVLKGILGLDDAAVQSLRDNKVV